MPQISLTITFYSFALGIFAWGQAAAPTPADSSAKAPAYEVISIKPDKSGGRNGVWQPMPDGMQVTNMALLSLVYNAYGIVMDSQVSGLPNWVESDPYDIEAKVDAETAETWKKMTGKERWEQQKLMMQSLLADRCKLKVHRETRELPVYDLVISKGGTKMKEALPNESGSEMMSNGRISGHAQQMISVVYGLSNEVGRMIVDKTGLGDKKFDFELKWTPDDERAADGASDVGPSIFTALEEQLGLKLVPDKGPVEVLVIDHMERPSAN